MFKQVFYLILEKQHLTSEGLLKIVSIKTSSNLGLPDRLKEQFPSIVPVVRPEVTDQTIKDPNWISGFTAGEACFRIKINKSKTKIGHTVWLKFTIAQHVRDVKLLNSLIDYLGCGSINKANNCIEFVVTGFTDIRFKIIPQRSSLSLRDVVSKTQTPRFFEKYPFHSAKSYDFQDFCIAAKLIEEKAHLTQQGFEKLLALKQGMNRGREE